MINKPIKINRNDYKRIVFASDFHYNHLRDFIWKPRGFNTFYEHDKFIESECDKLTADDLLIYLGDFALNTSKEAVMALFHRIQAQVFFIFGNHNSMVLELYKTALKDYLKLIDSVIPNNDLNLHGTHEAHPYDIFPFSVNKFTKFGQAGRWDAPRFNFTGTQKNENIVFFGEEETFNIGNMFYCCRHMAPLIWDKMKYENQVCLTGHSHGNSEQLNIHHKIGKVLDVGMDNTIKYNKTAFFDVEEIEKIMKKKEIKIWDHHGDENI